MKPKIGTKWNRILVTPCVGVWIETLPLNEQKTHIQVTPCVGVWIETTNSPFSSLYHVVTPCVGVWIETLIYRRLIIQV